MKLNNLNKSYRKLEKNATNKMIRINI